MPRVALSIEQKKAYKLKDFNGWVVKQMKINGLRQSDVAEALGVKQSWMSKKLAIPKKGEKLGDRFSYGDLLLLFDLFQTSDEEKKRLLTL